MTRLTNSAAIVGIGRTPYYRRGESAHRGLLEMACEAILLALADAGIEVDELDGFANSNFGFANAPRPELIAQVLGLPEVRFAATLTAGGTGSPGAIGLAAAAVATGMAEVVVSLFTLQQAPRARLGAGFQNLTSTGSKAAPNADPTPERDFVLPSGLVGPGQSFALLTQRHMHLYGTTREHLAEVAIATRQHATTRPGARMRDPLTLDTYLAAPMITDPFCLYDYCLESEGAVAVVTTSADRARALRHPPVYVRGTAHGGAGRWGQSIRWMGMPDDYFASAGHRTVARRVYEMARVSPREIDVALLYDHFSSMVLMQLEDYRFCPVGESGGYVADGGLRWPTARTPVNTHGGNLSDAYLLGATHIVEGVEQIRGTATNQVAGADLVLVTGGPGALPAAATILGSTDD